MRPNQKQQRKRKQPGITTRTRLNGQVRYQVYCGRDANGKQHFKTFSDRNEAETFLEKLGIAKANEGQQLWSVTPDQRTEAARCFKTLQPYGGATLTAAVSHYVETVLKYRNAPTVSEIIKKLVARCADNKRREVTIYGLNWRLKKFSDVFGERQLSSITVGELQKYMDVPGAARTRIDHATKISQLFNYAIRNGWCAENLVKRLEHPTVEDDEVEIFTVAEALKLLEHANEFGLLPYIAIGLFAGVRSEELHRLNWSAVKLSERAIVIGSEVAKKRSRRAVTISDTLASWIAPYIKPSGSVTPRNARWILKKLAAKAKVKWKSNGLRHSFGSYHYAMYHDTASTAAEMGHHDPTIVHDHYKAVVLKSDAERYWNLRPAGVAEGKVIPMQQAAG